jgi:hypothetical protein
LAVWFTGAAARRSRCAPGRFVLIGLVVAQRHARGDAKMVIGEHRELCLRRCASTRPGAGRRRSPPLGAGSAPPSPNTRTPATRRDERPTGSRKARPYRSDTGRLPIPACDKATPQSQPAPPPPWPARSHEKSRLAVTRGAHASVTCTFTPNALWCNSSQVPPGINFFVLNASCSGAIQ